MKRLLGILVFLLVAAMQTAVADYRTSMRQGIVPPSPTSARFAQSPVRQPSLATGAVRLDIPLYTIRAFGFELPISLLYSSGGIRVDDDPYPCGYGWNLMPGLRISRTILGRPDEEVPAERFATSPPSGGEDDTVAFFRNCVSDNTELYDRTIDTEHDIFSLHLPNLSCSFIILHEGDGFRAVHNAGDHLRFDISPRLTSITVTDGRSVRYLFSGEDAYTERPDWRTNAITAWFLREIALPNGERLSFRWKKYSHAATTNVTLNAYTLRDDFNRTMVAGHRHDGESADGASGYVLSLPDGTAISGSYSGFLHLDGIVFPGGAVAFSYMSGNDPYLTSAIVRDEDGGTVWETSLAYSSDSVQGKLLECADISDSGIYRFGYNPQRFACRQAQDFWGFYNGRTGNALGDGSLTPRMRFRAVNGRDYESWVDIGSADRSVDTAMMQANMLTRVTYPTGGFTSFEYEPHHLRHTDAGLDSDNIAPSFRKPLDYGGGLRLKRAVSGTGGVGGGDSPDVVTEYVYQGFGSDMAHCVAFPELESFIDGYEGCEYARSESGLDDNVYGCQFRSLYFTGISNCLDIHLGETPIWYDTVTEMHDKGCTVHSFRSLAAPVWENSDRPKRHTLRFHSDFDAIFSHVPVETSVRSFRSSDSGFVPVAATEYGYAMTDLDSLSALPAMQVKRNIACSAGRYAPDICLDANGYVEETDINGSIPRKYLIDTSSGRYGAPYEYNLYSVRLHTERLYSITEKEFFGRPGDTMCDSVVRHSHREYLGLSPLVLRSSSSCSDDSYAVTSYSYPLDSVTARRESPEHSGVLRDMRSHNAVSVPYRVTTARGDAVSVSGRVFARVADGLFRPECEYSVRDGDSVTVRRFGYDVLGNIRDIAYYGGGRESYIWGYGGRYPIFAIEGISYAGAASLLSVSGVGAMPPLSCSTPGEYLDGLRSSIRGLGLVTMYEYRPLVGLSSVTDAHGVRTDFRYDSHNRLALVSVDGLGSTKEFRYALNVDGSNSITARTFLSADAGEYTDSIIYFDGLGRPVQSVSGLAVSKLPSSPTADFSVYDTMGRLCQSWSPAPYSGSGGFFPFPDFCRGCADAYGDCRPFSLTEYEPSPLCRAVKVTGAGEAWHSAAKGVSTAYAANSGVGDYACRMYSVGADGSVSLRGMYAPCSLRVTEAADEDGRRTLSFSDLEGRTLLVRRFAEGATPADTYYVYDDFGDLRLVLPPMASAEMSATGQSWDADCRTVRGLCYLYRYNASGDVTFRRLPGREPELYVYDRAGKLMLSQDGNMRGDGKWRLHLYERFGREAVTAVSTGPLSVGGVDSITSADVYAVRLRVPYEYQPLALKPVGGEVLEPIEPLSGVAGNVRLGGYAVADRLANADFRLPGEFVPETVRHYDGYAFLDSLDADMRQKFSPLDLAGSGSIAATAPGLCTGFSSVLSDGSGRMLLSVTYYDRLGRTAQSCSENISGGVDHTGLAYTFTGLPSVVEKSLSHASTSDQRFSLAYGYDAEGRTLSVDFIGGDGRRKPLLANSYDALGRLCGVSLGGGATSLGYSYNVHGWLTGITGSLFSQRLHYQDAAVDGSPCWGGDVSAEAWSQRGPSGSAVRSGAYGFSYDGLDRLSSARFSGSGGRDFSCRYAYDLHGNATRIQRIGISDRLVSGGVAMDTFGVIDDVSLRYDGNQLVCADDAASSPVFSGATDFRDGADEVTEYAYDANGNLTRDLNRDIRRISYDNFNMPRTVTFGERKSCRFTYDASGRKLRAEYVTPRNPMLKGQSAGADDGTQSIDRYRTTTVDYCGDNVYRYGRLWRTLLPTGYMENDSLFFFVRDFWGNVRLVVREDGEVVESSEYYPYGALFDAANSVQPYKYGGKELDRTHGLDWYDFGARMLDPTLARWASPDPLSEKYYHLSPYAYCAGNPIKYSDPTGMYIETAWDVANLIMDGASLWDNAKNGNIGAALVDGVGAVLDLSAIVLPGVPGGAGSAIKAYRGVEKAVDVEKAVVHGNSKLSTKAQHIYEIYNTKTGDVVKTGISSGKIAKNGKSYRATRQVNKWNKAEGKGKYDSRIVQQIPAGKGAREKALDAEKRNAEKHRNELDPQKHKKP